MENVKTTTGTAKRGTRSKKTIEKVAENPVQENIVADNVADRVTQNDESNKNNGAKRTVTDVDQNQIIIVRNGHSGKLVYKSKKTGEKYVWPEFGSEQEFELKELRSAKNNSKNFFIKNWFMFDEDWIPQYLGVAQYYRNSVNLDDFDNVLTSDADTIKERLSALSDGQKHSMAYRAKELIKEGKIDSNKAISALEEVLGVDLVERW